MCKGEHGAKGGFLKACCTMPVLIDIDTYLGISNKYTQVHV